MGYIPIHIRASGDGLAALKPNPTANPNITPTKVSTSNKLSIIHFLILYSIKPHLESMDSSDESFSPVVKRSLSISVKQEKKYMNAVTQKRLQLQCTTHSRQGKKNAPSNLLLAVPSRYFLFSSSTLHLVMST